jgi:hypothetical protein
MSDLEIIANYDLKKLRKKITPLFTGLERLRICNRAGKEKTFKSAEELIATMRSQKRFSLYTYPGAESIGWSNRSVIDYYRMCQEFFADPFEFLAFIELQLTKRFGLFWCGDIQREVIMQSDLPQSICYKIDALSPYDYNYISPIKAYILKLRFDRIGKIN